MAIPADTVGWKAGAHRLVTVTAVGILVERQRHHPIVRQIHRVPWRIVEFRSRRSPVDAGIDDVLLKTQITQVKFPTGIEQQAFARGNRRGGGDSVVRVGNLVGSKTGAGHNRQQQETARAAIHFNKFFHDFDFSPQPQSSAVMAVPSAKQALRLVILYFQPPGRVGIIHKTAGRA